MFLLSVDSFAQKDQSTSVFKEVYELPAKVLSTSQQSRLQKLKQTDNFLNVTLIKVEGLAKAIKENSLDFDLPGISIKANIKTKSIDYSAKNNFIWNGTFNKGEVILINENGRTYGHIRNNGSVFDIQYLENGYAALIEYNMEKLNQIN
ncbi:MAG: hypothetical protein IIC74_02965 [Bacteroidetes bacterium]|nr:hypothetical protein [Bacteroidota bacterium]